MYYNSYPYFIYTNHYPLWIMSHHSSTQFPRQVAIQEKPNNNTPFPPVNTHKLKISAKQIPTIMQQVNLLVDKIAQSEQFAHDLMNAAQLSNKTAVNQLITSTGVNIKFDTNYTPGRIEIHFTGKDCCGITIVLDW